MLAELDIRTQLPHPEQEINVQNASSASTGERKAIGKLPLNYRDIPNLTLFYKLIFKT